MRPILQVLVCRVRVHRGHQATLDAKVLHEHLGERREAVCRARGVRDDGVLGRVVGALVDAKHERCDVVASGRSRDDDLLGARGDVHVRILRLGEAARRFDDDIHAQFAPRQLGRVALFEHDDRLTVDNNLVAVELDRGVETPGNAVVLEQVRKRSVVGEVVDSDDLEVASLSESRSEEVTANATEAVDTDLDAQWNSRCLGVKGRIVVVGV